MALEQGEHEEARQLAEELLKSCRELGNRRLEAFTLATLGQIALSQRDYRTAYSHLRASLLIQQELGDLASVAAVLERFVELAMVRGLADAALRLAAAAGLLRTRTGAPLRPSGPHAVRVTLADDESLLQLNPGFVEQKLPRYARTFARIGPPPSNVVLVDHDAVLAARIIPALEQANVRGRARRTRTCERASLSRRTTRVATSTSSKAKRGHKWSTSSRPGL